MAQYVEVDLGLLEYYAFGDEEGQRGLVCTRIDFGEPPEAPEIPTVAEKLKDFQDTTVGALPPAPGLLRASSRGGMRAGPSEGPVAGLEEGGGSSPTAHRTSGQKAG
jgi:hypothetical protein